MNIYEINFSLTIKNWISPKNLKEVDIPFFGPSFFNFIKHLSQEIFSFKTDSKCLNLTQNTFVSVQKQLRTVFDKDEVGPTPTQKTWKILPKRATHLSLWFFRSIFPSATVERGKIHSHFIFGAMKTSQVSLYNVEVAQLNRILETLTKL